MFRQRLSKLTLITLLISFAPFAIKNYSPVNAEITKGYEALDPAKKSQVLEAVEIGWIALGEFLADRQFTDEEKAWIAKAEIEHFQQDPQNGAEGLKGLRSIFAKIKELESNPIQLARYRENLFATKHLNRVKSGNPYIQDYLTVVYRYSPVVVTDVEAGLVVTEKDIDSIHASNNFVSQLAFKTDYGSINDLESLKQNFSNSYSSMSLKEKKLYAQAEGRRDALLIAWKTVKSGTRQKLANAIVNNTGSIGNVPKMARILEDSFYYTQEEREEKTAQTSQNSGQLTPKEQSGEWSKAVDEMWSRHRAFMDAVGESNVIQGTQHHLIP
ncbi:MAG: hypothetical protein AAGE84_21015 [Cyanobacteria bacterium P01_G01_bin.39]